MATDYERQRYGAISIANHWVLAVAAIAMLSVGLVLDEMPRGEEKARLLAMHMASGMVVLVLASWRLYWRLRNGFPKLGEDVPGWEAALARAAHWFFLLALIIMPLSGLFWSLFDDRAVSVFGLFTIPALGENEALAGLFHEVHELLAYALIAIIVLHVLAALKRQFVNRDGTLTRMLGGR